MIYNHTSLEYHPQANGAIGSFNKTLTKGLTNICNIKKNDWASKMQTILQAYITTYKRYIGQTHFKMVYG